MSTQNSNQQGGQEPTIGVGNATSGDEGATLTHETMQETGGSGGPQMTKPNKEEAAPRAPVSPGAGQRQDDEADSPAEGADTAATAITRGYQDTRSRQASPGSTGLGTPETGGNQDERDLAPPRKE
jgi:hypothetical protein